MGAYRPDVWDPSGDPHVPQPSDQEAHPIMYAVIFEVEPEPDREREYLDIATRLRSEVEKIEGFISIERFKSLSQDGKILSLSFWKDEKAIERWRQQAAHHAAQVAGRDRIFRDYRIRVAEVSRDYGMYERTQAPQLMPAKPHEPR